MLRGRSNIGSIPRNACGASGDIFIWYLMSMIANKQGVKEKHMSPYIELKALCLMVGKLCTEFMCFQM